MSIHDELTDNEVLRAASDSLSAIPVASPPEVEAIMAMGRSHRRRRLSAVAGLSVAAAGTALAIGLSGVVGAAPARTTGTIRAASFTLVSYANGTATLTINPNELLDTAALQKDLEHYGIPAMVTSGSFCSSDPVPSGFSQVVSFYPAPPFAGRLPNGVHPTVTFNPAAMPTGTELSFGVFQPSSGLQTDTFELVNSSSYTCSSSPPQAPDDGMQFRLGHAGS